MYVCMYVYHCVGGSKTIAGQYIFCPATRASSEWHDTKSIDTTDTILSKMSINTTNPVPQSIPIPSQRDLQNDKTIT